MMFTNPIFLGFLTQAPPAAPPATRTIELSPMEPGTLGDAPADLLFTVTTTGGQTEVKWAVFNDDWTAAAHTASWQILPIPGGGIATFTATFTATGQRVQVKSSDESITVNSGQATLGVGAPARPSSPPSSALAIVPAQPGTLAPVNGVARFQAWIGSNIYSSLLWVAVNGAGAAVPYSFKGDWKSATLSNGWALVTVDFDASGQFLKIGNPGNPSETMDSGTVTLTVGTSNPGSRAAPTEALQFDPLDPGTITPVNGVARWEVFIGSNVHTSLSWVVSEGAYAGYAWRGTWQTVQLVDGWAKLSIDFTQSGQFVKIADPNNTGQAIDSWSVTVPAQQPSDPLPDNPTPNPLPVGSPTARLDIVARGQSNAYYAQQEAGATTAMRNIVAHLTGIPTVNLVSRAEEYPNTIHSGTYSYADINAQGEWLKGIAGVNPGLWADGDPMAQHKLAVQQFVSTNPDHGILDVKVHWEYDMSVWQSEWADMYRQGQWEITRRIRQTAGKNANRVLTAYGYCSYQGADLSQIEPIGNAWAQDWDDGALMATPAAGNMVDGEVRVSQWGEDWSHNSNEAILRQWVRMGVYMSRRLWEIGWTPAGVDLSWVPTLGPRIVSASRSGSSVFLTIGLDKGTAMMGGASGTRWEDFWIPQLGGMGFRNQDPNGTATGGAFTAPNQIRVDFRSNVPANAQLWYCYYPRMTLGDGRNIIRDNWHQIRPSVSNTVPNIGLFDNLLQRTFRPVSIP